MDLFNIVLIFATMIITVIALLFAKKFNISMFGINISFSKLTVGDKLVHIKNLIEEHYKKIDIYQDNESRGQLRHIDSIKQQIRDNLRLEVSPDKALVADYMAGLYFKRCIVDNGFLDFDDNQLSNYIKDKMSMFKSLYIDHLGETKYVDSQEFFNLISELFNHAVECHKHWQAKIKEENDLFDAEYTKLTEGL